MDRLLIVITIVEVGEEDRIVVISIVSDVSAFGSWLDFVAHSGSGLSGGGACCCSKRQVVCISAFGSDASSCKRAFLVSLAKEITQEVTARFTLTDDSRNPDCSVVDSHRKDKESSHRVFLCKVQYRIIVGRHSITTVGSSFAFFSQQLLEYAFCLRLAWE
jgi:hypothetical protein